MTEGDTGADQGARPWGSRLAGPTILSIVLVGVSLSTSGNDFPYYHHWDEPSKISQVQHATRNYRHPPLMLNVAAALHHLRGGSLDRQEVVANGRFLSALYVGIAIGALSSLAYRLVGLPGALLVGITLLCNARLIDQGHYFKENAILLAGIGLSLLAMTLYLQRPSMRNLVWLALTCAFAGAAKFVGLVMVPAALLTVFVVPIDPRDRLRPTLVFSGVWIVVFLALIWHPVLWRNPDVLLGAQEREWSALLYGRMPGDSIPNWAFVREAARLSPACWFFVGALWWSAWRAGPNLAKPFLPCALFPIGFTILLTLQHLPYSQYFIPAETLFLTGAALGMTYCLRRIWALRRPALRWLLVATWCAGVFHVLSVHIVESVQSAEGRRNTSRDELTAWVMNELPASAVIAQDGAVRFPAPGLLGFREEEKTIPQRLLSAWSIAQLGNLEELRQQGVTHVAVELYWFHGNLREREPSSRFSRNQQFCADLAEEGIELVTVPSRPPYDINPGFIVFEIAKPRS